MRQLGWALLCCTYLREAVMQKKIAYRVIITVIAVVFGGWFYFAPYIAANNMKNAAEVNDPTTLSSYINFPSLKESFKANFNAILATEVIASKDNNPFEALGAAFATALINPMIDALVTPESLTMMMQGKKPSLMKDLPKQEKKSGAALETEVKMAYESYDRFIISVNSKEGVDEPVVFILHREGLFTWKLASIRLPAQKTKEVQLTPTPQHEELSEPPQLADLSKYVGQHPMEVFNELDVQEKFQALLGNEYNRFFNNLSVSSELELKGNFYVGSGCSPHNCTIDESAFAINKETGEAFATILNGGETIQWFGVNSEQNLPAPLYVWYIEHGGQSQAQ